MMEPHYCMRDYKGNIVDPTTCTGPATGLEYRDGKVRKVKK